MKRALSVFAPMVLAGTLLAGCLDDSITGTRPISFSLSADKTTAAAGEEITFQYASTGTQIQGIILEYGDGAIDSVFIGGTAIIADGPLMHTFTAPGTYLVRGRVETVISVKRDSISVQIN